MNEALRGREPRTFVSPYPATARGDRSMTGAELMESVLAGGTAILAVATGFLAWRTDRMAAATLRLASETKRLADETASMASETRRIADANDSLARIESERFEGERAPNLVPVRWDGTTLDVRNDGRIAGIVAACWVSRGAGWLYSVQTGVVVESGATEHISEFHEVSMATPSHPDTSRLPTSKVLTRIETETGDGPWVTLDSDEAR